MAKMIEVKVDDRKLKQVYRDLKKVPRDMGKLMYRAIDKTAKNSRKQIVDRIANEIALKKKDIRDSIHYDKPSYTRWSARLDVYTNRIPLIKFGAKQTKKGVSYRIEKSGGREKIKSAFITEMPIRGKKQTKRHEGVFKRTGKERLPIRELLGPSLGHVFENAGNIAEQVQSDTNKRLVKNIDAQLAMILERRRRSAA